MKATSFSLDLNWYIHQKEKREKLLLIRNFRLKWFKRWYSLILFQRNQRLFNHFFFSVNQTGGKKMKYFRSQNYLKNALPEALHSKSKVLHIKTTQKFRLGSVHFILKRSIILKNLLTKICSFFSHLKLRSKTFNKALWYQRKSCSFPPL